MIEKLKMEQNPMSPVLETLKQVCPGAINEDGTVDFDVLKTELSDSVTEGKRERYEFDWVGKENAKREYKRKIRKTLRPVVADSKNWETTKNLYIEGDNLDALKLLQKSYLRKVKMIYIDPPYNTGNDFVYCDDFAEDCKEYLDKKQVCDSEGNRLFVNRPDTGHYHSNWCNMMYPRLKMARDLLTNDGVIFISIDENEITNLRKLCDEVFGEKNFINVFSVRRGKKSLNSQFAKIRTLNIGFEYIVCYSKSTDFHYTNPFEESNEKQKAGSWAGLYNSPDRPTMRYPIGDITISQGQWKWSKEKGLRAYQNYKDFVATGLDESHLKEYWLQHKDEYKENTGFDLEFVKTTEKSASYWVAPTDKAIMDTSLDYQSSGDSSVKGLIGNVFSAPKPVKLISKILDMVIEPDSLVLDFFSGSATTAHAIMQLNAEDGGNRRFIMVQLPEKCDEGSEFANICEIGKERIRRAGEKIKAEHPDKDLDIGFRVLRVDSSNMKDVYYKPSETTQAGLLDAVDNIKNDRTDMDLLFGVMVDCGLPLDMPIETKEVQGKKYYVVDGNDALVACFEEHISEDLIREIASHKPMCAVFKDASFAEAKDKVNVSEIFKSICGDDKALKIL